MAGMLQLLLLGKLEIQRGGIPIAGMGSAKAQALQCALRSTRQDFSNDL